jgi:acyl carrier protein
MSDTAHQIRTFIAANFLFRDDCAGIDDAASLLDAEIIDSTGVLELVAFLEGALGIDVADAEIVPENLDSISAIVAYVERKQHAATGVAA